MQKKAETGLLRRILVVLSMFGVMAFVVIAARLYFMQVVRYDYYADKAKNQQTRSKTITPMRGGIYDTNMKPLAISASTEMVVIESVKVKDEAQAALIAQKLSEILGMDYETLYKKATKKTTYDVIKKGVEKEIGDQIRAFVKEHSIQGLYTVPDAKRYYPFKSFASHVIGFVGSDQQGLEGIEVLYEKYLVGTPGRIVTPTDAAGQEMPFDYETYVDAVDGYNVVLTIDEVIQHYVEQSIQIAYNDYDVQEYVACIVMDIKTGGILAMAATPEFDPNEPFTLADPKAEAALEGLSEENRKTEFSKLVQGQWRNHLVSDTYEPGSTFKILTASMALEEKTMSLNSTFTCTGSTMVPGWGKPIRCWKAGGHGTQTFAQAVENSCNPAFIAIGRSLGTETFSKYFEAFGLTEKTGVDAMGESTSIYHKKSTMKEIDLATSSFGQTFQVTPMQLITAVSAVANKGYLMKPHIVKEIVDQEGNVIESFQNEPVRQVISEETSKTMMKILEGVVATGTGKNAYVPGYRVGGKTGTSEKKAKQAILGRDDLRITSFMAVAPVDDPQIAVLVLLDEPNSRPISGGVQAAPVVRKVIEDTLPYLGVEPIYTEAELAIKDQTVPSVIGTTESAAAAQLKSAGFGYRKVGSGDTVTDQMPAAGAAVPPSVEVVLYMGEAKPTNTIVVPDLTGMKYETAKNTLKAINMYMSSGGMVANNKHVVRKQSVPAGTEVPIGTVVIVELTDPSQGEVT